MARTRVGEAMRDMPEHQGIAALLSGAHINYFHCLRIVEILKETEADTKIDRLENQVEGERVVH